MSKKRAVSKQTGDLVKKKKEDLMKEVREYLQSLQTKTNKKQVA